MYNQSSLLSSIVQVKRSTQVETINTREIVQQIQSTSCAYLANKRQFKQHMNLLAGTLLSMRKGLKIMYDCGGFREQIYSPMKRICSY